MNVLPSASVVPLASLSDDDLLTRLSALLKASRRVEAVLVAHIGEVDARRLYARESFRSMFAYCTDFLGLSEPEAYLRITVARAARGHPGILDMLADGRLHLSGIALLVPHLHPDNATALLERASQRSKRQIEQLISELSPRPAVPDVVRRLPERPHPTPTAPSRPVTAAGPEPVPATPLPRVIPSPEPLAPDRFRIQFTANSAFCEKLDRLRDLMHHSTDGGLFAMIDRAVCELVDKLEARKFGQTTRPRAVGEARVADSSRYVPSDVRRTVFARDEGRCRFVAANGLRCASRRQLEFHHVEPHARGGKTSVANIQLMCRTHNSHLAERDFGSAHMARFRKGAPTRPPPREPSRA